MFYYKIGFSKQDQKFGMEGVTSLLFFYKWAINDLELTRWFCMTRQSVLIFLSKVGGNLQKKMDIKLE